MPEQANQNKIVTNWKFWASFVAIAGILGVLFYDGLHWMVSAWIRKEEYGYGFLIPAISAFLIWQKWGLLEEIGFKPAWGGVLVVTLGLFGLVLGEISTLYIVIEYSFIVTLVGVIISFAGWKVVKQIWAPLFILFFMIPLPDFLYTGLSTKLQLISSDLGVMLIRAFGISVHLEGNVIDLGLYRLQVVEACSGLRYLFPFACLSFLAAYIYKGSFWKKAVIFLSSIPITIFMNSFRIGAIGILVEYWGTSMAEGFLHDFEGWIIFMACMLILFVEMWALGKIGKDDGVSFADRFVLEIPKPREEASGMLSGTFSLPYIAAAVLTVVALAGTSSMTEREEIVPDRNDFSVFPLRFEGWDGRPDYLDKIYVDTLKFDDYLMVNYADPEGNLVNFYVAYYGSQRKGQSAHSPRTCIPGGGWKISGMETKEISGESVNLGGLKVNRVVIEKDDSKQLVYYWFQQRGRIITNEYLVKWYIFWDALTKKRTDGALVRVTTFFSADQDIDEIEKRLVSFLETVSPEFPRYIPN